MKRQTLILIIALTLLQGAQAQQSAPQGRRALFIGCRTDSGWAETPMLRTTFHIDYGELRHSDFQTIHYNLSVVSLGYHEVYVNNNRVCDDVLQPAVSQLDKRAMEVSYDISDLVHEGDNVLMLWLGQGWGRIYGTPAVARAEVSKTVSDGECGLIYSVALSDSSWQSSPSPYSYTGSWQPMQFAGERYDARIRERWRPASVFSAKDISVSRQEFEGNRIVDTLLPQRVDTLPDGSFLLDFGRVLTGWLQLQCPPIPEGNEITMEYLDHLEAKPPFTESDIYISNGTGDDDIHFSNRFHMHSFRYVKVKGLAHYLSYNPDTPILSARALQISAVNPYGGASFSCSDPRLNAIHDMVKYTLSCLTFSGYMVDCPHLERMGYGGDGNSSTMTLQTLWDVRDTYRNWLAAWADAMEPDGELPYVAPAFRTGGGPYWQGFIVKALWRSYINYADNRLLATYYDNAKRWMEYIENHCEDDLLQPWPDNERHSWFLGDWLAPEGVDIKGESVLHVSNCFISDCLADMEQMALRRFRPDDAKHFAAWRKKLNAAIHRHFYHPETHTYANGTPLDQAYALLMGIPPDSATAAAVKEQLLKDCHGRYRDHIAVGLVGVPVFTEWCIRERQTDLMATLLRQPDYPGYLHMINQGATTTWESWDCGRPGKEDRSRVHNCYNGIGLWFYQALAGIRPDPTQPGYRHFFIDPQPCDGIDWVRATKPTQYGTIRVETEHGILTVEIPEGTTATLFPGTTNEQTVKAGKWSFAMH